jgi:osmotically-inducible protein OsmY
MKLHHWVGLVAAGTAIFLSGCTPDSRVRYEGAGDNLSQAAEQTGEAIKQDIGAAKEAVTEATQKAVQSAQEASEKVGDRARSDRQGTTAQVERALERASDVDARNIDVEAVGNALHLSGFVPDEDQRRRASQIARAVAGTEYSIHNEISIQR